jgi:hypothetical protein
MIAMLSSIEDRLLEELVGTSINAGNVRWHFALNNCDGNL